MRTIDQLASDYNKNTQLESKENISVNISMVNILIVNIS